MRALRRLSPLVFLLLLGTLVVACDEPGGGGEGDDLASVVPPGKADDYLSPTSMEYRLWGEGQLTLDPEWADHSDADKLANAEEVLTYKFKAYSHFINEYLTNKESEEANADYGGFSGLVRPSSLDSMVEPTDASHMSFTFLWELELGGPRTLLSDLPVETNAAGETIFRVKLPLLTESQLRFEAYPRDFDPDTYEGEMEELEVSITAEAESNDAFPEYNALFEDGKLDILVLVGGDYNEARYDEQSAEKIFNWLKAAGYENPAEAYTDLTLESPPFTRTIDVNGRPVDIEVTFYYADIVPDAELDRLRDKIITAYETMDIVIYDGHAGQDPTYSGVVYHYNPRHAISAVELGQLNLPDKYQIFLFNGCKTYSVYPEAVMANERKTTANLDIISTVNFSWLTMQPFTTSSFLNELLAEKGGTHDPQTYVQILKKINESSNWNVYYGVHGIDDNPHVNPYFDESTLCSACATDADCPGVGNRCIQLEGGKVCGAECTADDGCPGDYRCYEIAEGTQIVGRQCLPRTFACE